MFIQNRFPFSIHIEQYELEYWFFKKFNLKTFKKSPKKFR